MKENTMKPNTNESAAIGLLSMHIGLLAKAGIPGRRLSATAGDCMSALMNLDVNSQLSFREAVASTGYTQEQAETICHDCEHSYANLGDDSGVARTAAMNLETLSQEIAEGGARLPSII